MSESRFYLNCPYEDRMECKGLGGRWDPDVRKWYVPEGVDRAPFEKWTGEMEQGAGPSGNRGAPREDVAEEDRIYLNCPYDQKDECKRHGGRWDPSRRKWYISKDTDQAPFEKWM